MLAGHVPGNLRRRFGRLMAIHIDADTRLALPNNLAETTVPHLLGNVTAPLTVPACARRAVEGDRDAPLLGHALIAGPCFRHEVLTGIGIVSTTVPSMRP